VGTAHERYGLTKREGARLAEEQERSDKRRQYGERGAHEHAADGAAVRFRQRVRLVAEHGEHLRRRQPAVTVLVKVPKPGAHGARQGVVGHDG
jgi:hypothetical protein